jgi:hypothetical protein
VLATGFAGVATGDAVGAARGGTGAATVAMIFNDDVEDCLER